MASTTTLSVPILAPTRNETPIIVQSGGSTTDALLLASTITDDPAATPSSTLGMGVDYSNGTGGEIILAPASPDDATNPNPANNYTGTEVFNSGTVLFNNAGAVGSGPIVLTNVTISGSDVTNGNGTGGGNITIGNAISFGGFANFTNIIATGPMTLTQSSVMTGAGTTQLDGNITDNGNGYSLTVAGNTDLLFGSNSFSGGLFLSGGSVYIQQPSGLGSGTIYISTSGSINTYASMTISNPIYLSNASTLTFAGTAPLTYTGSINITSAVGITDSDTGVLTFNTGTTTSSITGPGSLTMAGAGTFILPNANTYAGGTSITATSFLEIGNAGAFGPGLVNITGAAATLFSTQTAGITFTNPFDIGAAIVFQGTTPFTFNGPVLLSGNATIQAFDTVTINVPIQENAAGRTFGTVAAPGTLVLNTRELLRRYVHDQQ